MCAHCQKSWDSVMSREAAPILKHIGVNLIFSVRAFDTFLVNALSVEK